MTATAARSVARGLRLACGALIVLGTAAAQALPRGTVRTVDGRELVGEVAVAEDGVVTVRGADGEATLELAELVSFEQAGVEVRQVQVEDRVWLRSGLELPAKRLGGLPAADGQPARLVATLPSGIDVELPIGSLRALRHGGTMRPQPNLFPQDLASPPANEDLIYVVADGQSQRSAVIVTGIDARRIDFLLRGDPYDFELDGLAAVVFGANTGFAPDRQPRPRAALELSTGERLEGRLLSLGATARCRLDEGFVAEVPAAKVHRITVASDRLVWLTELDPVVEQTPAFDRVWPWLVDRSHAGPGFELAGRRFDRGLGLVPKTRLTYDLGRRFDVFEAVIGVDDRGGPEAHAVFRVLVDGEQVFLSEPLTRGQAPVPLQLPVQGAASLSIEVDFGKNYDLGDFCAFADARVIQK